MRRVLRSDLLFITLLLFLSSFPSSFLLIAKSSPNTNKLVNTKTSTLEPTSSSSKQKQTTKNVFVFENIKLTKSEEKIRIGVPYSQSQTKKILDSAQTIINTEIKKINENNHNKP